jgi:DNA replication ATP-dependent helicase Dna2
MERLSRFSIEKRGTFSIHSCLFFSVASQLTEALVSTGVNPSSIGIISPWRSQLKEIRQHLSEFGLEGIEVHTVDKYQGRDKECIIISLVRSNQAQNV